MIEPDNRKDPEMRERVQQLIDQSAAEKKQNDEDREALSAATLRLDTLSRRLNRSMGVGLASIVVGIVGLVIIANGLRNNTDDIKAQQASSKVQRQKASANACLLRREQNRYLLSFVPDAIYQGASPTAKAFLAGPSDCVAYGRKITTDAVPLPVGEIPPNGEKTWPKGSK